MDMKTLTDWLLQGDVSIQYQTQRDLLGHDRKELQKRTITEGWGAHLLSLQNADGHWGRGFYQPKWTSTHYTLLELRNINIWPEISQAARAIGLILEHEKAADGGVNPSRTVAESDVCVNGMFLNYACWFGTEEAGLRSVIDFVLSQQMDDGGFNCRLNRSGARHGSLHSTLSVAEGLLEYRRQGYTYRLHEAERAEAGAREFMLMHRIFLSDRTGNVIRPEFKSMHFPPRWKYDILRALDYFWLAAAPYDKRLQPALDWLQGKRLEDGSWPLSAPHPGQVHFSMEKAGRPSRWNTLRALRVLRHFKQISDK